jgi:hypothetical protein
MRETIYAFKRLTKELQEKSLFRPACEEEGNTERDTISFSRRVLLHEAGKKVKLSLCFFLTKHHAMKVYWGVEV